MIYQKTNLTVELFSKSKEKDFNKVKIKLKHLKSNIKQLQAETILCDDEVKTCLESLHRRFAIVAVDKVANNYVLTIF